MFNDATIVEIEAVMQDAWKAFHIYRNYSPALRAKFMRAIANEIGELGDTLLQVAASETQLTEPRLRSERARTIFQLTSYADACERGDWLEARIDTADSERNPPKPDIRKMMVAIGPVVVFGAANFPFAYSTAGGDTACALAAGCPVIVKSHPSHAETSELVAGAILRAAKACDMPVGVFAHVHGTSFDVGKTLVEHPYTKAVGFTGSFSGGKQLFDWANQRKEPIPVFAEMSSINPVFLLPDRLKKFAPEVAELYAASITLGVGQFCTNPGLLIGLDNKDLKKFTGLLADAIRKVVPGDMLHSGIFKNYVEKRANAIAQEQVEMVAVSETDPQLNQGAPTIATVTADAFINNPILHQEVFGPYSLIVRCRDMQEMLKVARSLEGQLTATLMATKNDLRESGNLIEALKDMCGRFIMNSVPTGVEVCQSMQHGGPFPATTDSRFTSVGSDGIKRFTRPIAFQNWSNDLLPDALKNENPLGIWRTVNNEVKKNRLRIKRKVIA